MKTYRCERHCVTLTLDSERPHQWDAHVDRGVGWPSACGLLTNPEKRAGELAVHDQNGSPTKSACTVREVE